MPIKVDCESSRDRYEVHALRWQLQRHDALSHKENGHERRNHHYLSTVRY
jgi:hypothetical protein